MKKVVPPLGNDSAYEIKVFPVFSAGICRLTPLVAYAQEETPYILNGSTIQESCNCYQLTYDQMFLAGSVWNKNLIDLNNLLITFLMFTWVARTWRGQMELHLFYNPSVPIWGLPDRELDFKTYLLPLEFQSIPIRTLTITIRRMTMWAYLKTETFM